MNKDSSELVKYLDKKFSGVDKKFDKTDIELANIKEDVKDLKQDMTELKESVRSLTNSIDGLTKAIETYHHEQVSLSAKVDRHEKWIYQIAKKTGVELNP